jgi:nitrogen fixation NifU-like protein
MEDSLYREIILDHYKNPRNAGRLDVATHAHRELNPSCGDAIDMTLKVDGLGRIMDVKFEGHGCAISQASASILTETIKGKPVVEVQKIDQAEMFRLLGVPVHGSRLKCALLGLKAMHQALESGQVQK